MSLFTAFLRLKKPKNVIFRLKMTFFFRFFLVKPLLYLYLR